MEKFELGGRLKRIIHSEKVFHSQVKLCRVTGFFIVWTNLNLNKTKKLYYSKNIVYSYEKLYGVTALYSLNKFEAWSRL